MRNDSNTKMLHSIGKPYTNLDSNHYVTITWGNKAYKTIVYLALYPK